MNSKDMPIGTHFKLYGPECLGFVLISKNENGIVAESLQTGRAHTSKHSDFEAIGIWGKDERGNSIYINLRNCFELRI